MAGINDRTSGKGIKQIDFYLRNYPHYHSCSIGRYIDKFNINGETIINTRFHNEPNIRFVFLVRRPFQNLGDQQTGRGYRPERGDSTISILAPSHERLGIFCLCPHIARFEEFRKAPIGSG